MDYGDLFKNHLVVMHSILIQGVETLLHIVALPAFVDIYVLFLSPQKVT